MSVPFILAMQVLCGTTWFNTRGAFICKQDLAEKNTIRLKMPLTKGQFSALDCNGVLTEDGNVDDFNTESIKEGFLWWSRKKVVVSKTPEFSFRRTYNHNDCSVNIAMAAENAGAQQAVLQYETKSADVPLNITYTCASAKYSTINKESPWSHGLGMGGCNALVDSEMKLKIFVLKDRGIVDVINQCITLGFEKVVFGPNEKVHAETDENGNQFINYAMRIKDGICPMRIDYSYLDQTVKVQTAKLLVVGNPRDGYGMDTPTVISVTKGHYKVIRPLTSTIVFAEAFDDTAIKWRSDVKTSDFEFDLDEKFKGTLCVSAYSKDNAFEGACYTMPGLVETVFTFK